MDPPFPLEQPVAFPEEQEISLSPISLSLSHQLTCQFRYDLLDAHSPGVGVAVATIGSN